LSVGLLYFTVIPYNLISRSWRGVLDTTLCDKVCQWHATGRWFSPGTPVSSTSKTDHHDIAELLLKVALNTINQTNNLISYYNHHHKHILNDFVNVYSISLITQLIFLYIISINWWQKSQGFFFLLPELFTGLVSIYRDECTYLLFNNAVE